MQSNVKMETVKVKYEIHEGMSEVTCQLSHQSPGEEGREDGADALISLPGTGAVGV